MFKRKERQATLYRQYDAEGVLLYVGITLKLGARTSQHRHKAAWFRSIAMIRLEHFDTLAEAMRAEKVAIDGEDPLWNRKRGFVPPPKPKWEPLVSHNYPVTFGGVRLTLEPGGLVSYELPGA